MEDNFLNALSEEHELTEPVTVGYLHNGVKDEPSLPIKLEEGHHNSRDIDPAEGGIGRIHILARHEKQIIELGYLSVKHFVEDVIHRCNEIRVSHKTYFLICRTEEETSSSKHNSVLLHLVQSKHEYYRVATAAPYTHRSLKKYDLLRDWTATQSRPTEQNDRLSTTPISEINPPAIGL